MKLKNKVALITGASRGIGKTTALLFAQEGAKVIINYKSSKEKAEALAKKIGKMALAVQADVSQEKDVERLIKEAVDRFEKIDILINNAGEIIRPGDWRGNEKTWQKTVDINLTSIWLMIRQVAPIMQKQNGGNIVNLTSTVGILGVAPVLAYSAAKGGVISLTKAFAKELAPSIRVNAVAPSNVKTDMTRGAGQELIDRFKRITPLQRIAEPEELAKAILFLASEDSSYVTGHVLVVDGGYSLK
ncbi:hypothetical protein A2866_06090 [Candidatus Roizmanbacteria bacterium RIFCSPHIGHO2_01_FULL_39_8]|uniref:Beta-ketoacyl-ACP reductase n=3 Tax=Candidatus Roizmaniibacteriota TaxID=1752723 RepID=A0A1F7GSE6_9BACT|nr:MAG: hypothetical protein A2866_06090 [Candidatus Roizmanbacteria bacterium RIFCSPHIGHO2_01_FULL_39_8]OGK27209.1 MAG: hypothetical protein A3C28_04190 [Candidatus Roizmanbacteria bacterium RIFCSPHIGHO2_02_FULL_39_9]OGK37433.1 MAG: hypothetical protein A3F60_00705 [Candidatus Roizmanbacteria bacterium RIFCSPHIGHO2_12_FULL_39_8]